ncbi:RNA polymerase ECF-type sigma factor, partial [gut metagenome]
MSKHDRDIWDDAVRSKLEDFEVDTMPGDWEAIVDRLPAQATISLWHRLSYWAAAAVVSILLISGGLFLIDREMDELTAYED